MNRKVTVVGGAGNVGATVARAIAVKELADVVIVDIAAEKAQGIALDIFQACPIDGSDTRLIGTSDYAATRRLGRGRHHVRRAAQARHEPRRPAAGQLQDHAGGHRAGREVLAELHHRAGRQSARRDVPGRLPAERFPRERVVGMAGVLDSARMRTFIAMELNVSVENIHAFVLGGHGDTMVPLPRFSTVAGIPLTELVAMGYLSQAKLDEICTRTANGGAEITKLVGTSAWYAPGAAAAEMVEAILKDKKAILPCSVFLQGEYGVRDQFLGVPVKLGKGGAETGHRDQADPRGAGGADEVRRRRQGADDGDRGVVSWPLATQAALRGSIPIARHRVPSITASLAPTSKPRSFPAAPPGMERAPRVRRLSTSRSQPCTWAGKYGTPCDLF